MKLGVLANCYGKLTLDEALAKFAALGIETVEIGAGGYPKKAHCDPAVLLADENEYNKFMATFKKYGIEPCALAAHGNPVHPNKEIAAEFDLLPSGGSDFHGSVKPDIALGTGKGQLCIPPEVYSNLLSAWDSLQA